MNKKTITTLASALVAAAAAFSLSACGSSSGTSTPASVPATPGVFAKPSGNEKGTQGNPVNIGVVGVAQTQWTELKTAAQAEGIYIKYTDFTDYTQPNQALAQGQLDLNEFQHILFLAQSNQAHNATLVPIGSTAIYPLGLYSKKYTNVADIPSGSTITVPNDPTNESRAIGVLASAKLVTLTQGANPLALSPADVQSSSKVKVQPVAANQTARSLGDSSVAGAVINNDYIGPAGIQASSAIAKDDPNSASSAPFINIWVSQAKDATNPTYLEIIKLSQDAAYDAALQKNSGGTAVFIVKTPAELLSIYNTVASQLKK